MDPLQLLRDRLDLHLGFAHDPQWAAAPDFLRLIVEHTLTERPSVIVECGSGTTTLMLARCCQINGTGRVYSLEHEPAFAERTRSELARYDLQAYASVLDAPLVEHRLGTETFAWYDPGGLTAFAIDLLVIDGPPGQRQRHARYPALPVLFPRLAARYTVFLDDAARADEREIIRRWQRDYPGLDHRLLDTERGCSVLHWGPVRADG